MGSDSISSALTPSVVLDEFIRQRGLSIPFDAENLRESYVASCGDSGDKTDLHHAQSLKRFFELTTLVPQRLNRAYEGYLRGGKNCPEDSPVALTEMLLNYYNTVRNLVKLIPSHPEFTGYMSYGVDELLLASTPSIGGTAHANVSRLDLLAGQSKKIIGAIERGSFSYDELATLKIIRDLLQDPKTTKIGEFLFHRIHWDIRDEAIFPPYLSSLAKGIAEFVKYPAYELRLDWWRQKLEGIVKVRGPLDALNRNLVPFDDDDAITFEISNWAYEITDNAESAAHGEDPRIRTLLLLIEKGETEFVEKYLTLTHGFDKPPPILDALMYVVAVSDFNESRRELIYMSVLPLFPPRNIFEFDQSHLLELKLFAQLVALLSYHQYHRGVEARLGYVLDKPAISHEEGLIGIDGHQVITLLVQRLLTLYHKLSRENLHEKELAKAVTQSTVARLLQVASGQYVNKVRATLIREVLGIPDEFHHLSNALRTLLNPKMKNVLDKADPNSFAFERYTGLQGEKKKGGGGKGGQGGISGTPPKPAPPVSSPSGTGSKASSAQIEFEYLSDRPDAQSKEGQLRPPDNPYARRLSHSLYSASKPPYVFQGQALGINTVFGTHLLKPMTKP